MERVRAGQSTMMRGYSTSRDAPRKTGISTPRSDLHRCPDLRIIIHNFLLFTIDYNILRTKHLTSLFQHEGPGYWSRLPPRHCPRGSHDRAAGQPSASPANGPGGAHRLWPVRSRPQEPPVTEEEAGENADLGDGEGENAPTR